MWSALFNAAKCVGVKAAGCGFVVGVKGGVGTCILLGAS